MLFDQKAAETYINILRELAENPPSEQMMDATLVEMVQGFVKTGETSPLAVWNFYKYALDMTVHSSLGGSFIVRLFDLEGAAKYQAPPDGFAQADGSIAKAPWRQRGAHASP